MSPSIDDDRDAGPLLNHQPSKRWIGASPDASPTLDAKTKCPRDIQSILNLPEDVIWSLRKEDLRSYFFILQRYALNPHPLPPLSFPSTTTIATPDAIPSPFLRLPVELRQQIFALGLPCPVNPPILGPHPRQLQSPLHLSQPITPSLLLVSHQIRSEALPILYSNPKQTVSIKIDYNLWTHKSTRSSLILSSDLVSSINNIDLSIHLGSERLSKNSRGRIDGKEAAARVAEVKKGIKKLGKWLSVSGAEVEKLRVNWQEPSETFRWEVKKEILDGLKGLGARSVVVGTVNWGLGEKWNRGRKLFRFEVGYLRELERGWGGGNVG